MLKRALEKLRDKHPGVRIIYGDYFTPIIQFILQPKKFGELLSFLFALPLYHNSVDL